MLHSSGFSEVYCFEDSLLPHGLKSAIRWALWKLIRSGLRLYLAAETGVTNGVFTQNFLVVTFK
ncbi:MAG: hypothetical protein JO355_03405 [Planctomycetaceae bacterium]|nr:hypothetical protein [Planctomycetaceae bacterium]